MEKEHINFFIPSLKFNIETIKKSNNALRGIHSHKAAEFVWIKNGEASCFADGKEFLLNSKTILFINSQTPHYIKNISASEITYIQTEFSAPDEFSNSIIYDFVTHFNSAPYFLATNKSPLWNIFFDIKKEADKKEPYYEIYIKSYTQKLQGFLLRNNIIIPANSKTFGELKSLEPMTNFAEKNFMYPMNLDILAKKINCGKFELCRKFKKLTGSTVVDYINYIRIKNAEEKLESTEKTITEIALECGFSSIQYFNKVFKKSRGCSPLNYRKHII